MRTTKACTLLLLPLSLPVLAVPSVLVCTQPTPQRSALPSGTFGYSETKPTAQGLLIFPSYPSQLSNGVNISAVTRQLRPRAASNVLGFLIHAFVDPSFLQPQFTENTSTNAAENPELFLCRARKGEKLGIGNCRRRRCRAAEMEAKQREILRPALVKLDQLCRFLLSEDQNGNNDEEEMLVENSWNHTLLPLAFRALTNFVRGENSGGLFSCFQDADTDILRSKMQQMAKGGEKGDSFAFDLYSDLLSKVIGIPCAPRRKHVVPRNETKKELETGRTVAEGALELPTAEVIEFIGKQIGRFPYGLLSVARARRARSMADSRTEGGKAEAANEKGGDDVQIIPQVLTVSPFWVADQYDKKSRSFLPLPDARQRVINSVAKLKLFGTNFGKEKGSLANSITPFPTTFWLCDGRLSAKISEIELTGWMKEMENGGLLENTEIQERVINDNIRFIALRWLLIPKWLLSHFYSTNRRCGKCREERPEGYLFPEYANEKYHHCPPKGAQGAADDEEDMHTIEKAQHGNRGVQCMDCSECSCMICKLLQCHRLRGVGGLLNFCRIRCLHMQYAYHLACPTTLGNMLDDLFGVHTCID